VPKLERSWLVQRLKQPQHFTVQGKPVDNPFSFGGGYKNGGLTDRAMDLIRPIMSFDYMGSAEFEFGALPKALGKLVKADGLTAWSFSVTKANRGWRKKDAQKCDATVYALAPVGWQQEVESRVREWAVDPSVQMKERTGLGSVLLPEEDWDRDVRGWLELDNGFFFFTDEEMWRKTAGLFDAELALREAS
jgi:hypothetical protein